MHRRLACSPHELARPLNTPSKGCLGAAPRDFELRWLVLALVIALVHGLLYVLLVPPWSHYDEPAHFEYVALIARHGRLPHPDEVDVALRRELGQSLARTGFNAKYGGFSDQVLADGTRVPGIGYSQLNDPPAYFVIASVPTYLLRYASIETQLRGARLVSVLLLLLTVTCAWGIAQEMAPSRHPLRLVLPCATALLPTLVDVMSALGNTNLAIAAVSLFLWGAVRFVKRGSLRLAIWPIFVGVLLRQTHNTAQIALPAVLITLVIGFTRGRARIIVCGAMGIAILAAVLAAFNWDDPAEWYRNAVQEQALRCSLQTPCGTQVPPPTGSHAFQMRAMPAGEQPALVQILSPDAMVAIRGQEIVVGAYIWANAAANGVTVTMPTTRFFSWYVFTPTSASAVVTATPQPTWHTFTTVVPANADFGSVELAPTRPGAPPGATIYLSGLSLTAKHAAPSQQLNWIRNGSAERSWPWLRVPVQRLILRIIPDMAPYNFLMVPLDPPTAASYFGFTVPLLFESFWGRFGWAQVTLPQVVYLGCLLISVASLFALLLTWPNWRKWLSLSQATVLILVFMPAWVGALLRGTPYLQLTPFITVARYAFVAIVPTLMLILLGWTEGARWLAARLAIQNISCVRLQQLFTGVIVGAWGVYAVMSLLLVMRYFYG